MLEYIAYPKAMKLLTERLNASPEELAAWLFCGPELGGLAAYRNANELKEPPRFNYDDYVGADNTDYIAPLMGCWFIAIDIADFQPTERYITAVALIARWSRHPIIRHPEAFIRAKIEESRLADLHPIYGGTEVRFGENCPPLETGLFAIAEVEEIEALDFGLGEADGQASHKPAGHLNHDPDMQKKANEVAAKLIASTDRVPTKDAVAKILVVEIGMPFDTVLRRIRAEWKKKALPKYKNLP